MRVSIRAVWIVVFSLMLLPLASDVFSESTPRMHGIGYIDFRGKPRFKVGDWIKYHYATKSDDGRSEDYDLTVLISGEERFWGDDCFWVETWAAGRTLVAQQNAVLMSYSIFGDSSWLQHLEVYQRKSAQLGEDREIREELVRRVLGGRASSGDRASLTVVADTVGTDTAQVASGLYNCTKVVRKAGVGSVEERGDSTLRIENWSRRTLYLSPKIPMTSLVREVDERWITRKTWRVGKSADAVQNYAMRGNGTLTVVGWGSGDLKPIVTPVHARGKLARLSETRPAQPQPSRPRKRG